jgi:hypothetical protein
MNNGARIHWVRVLIGGFLAETSVIAVVIPVFLLFGQRAVAAIGITGDVFSVCSVGGATRRFALGPARNSGGSCRHASVRRINSGAT